jgi:hypothetical protein
MPPPLATAPPPDPDPPPTQPTPTPTTATPRQVHFLEVLFALVRRVSYTHLPMDAQMAAQERLMRKLPVLRGNTSVECEAVEWHAAARVQSAVRSYLARRRLRSERQSLEQAQQQ